MKKTNLLVIFLLFQLASFCQYNQVNIPSFRAKPVLPANTADWSSVPGALMLIAQKVPQANIGQFKLLMSIKKNSSKVCGNDFVTASFSDSFGTKTYQAGELTGIMGNCETLKPGGYTICAQFVNADNIGISKEVCANFKVEGGAPQTGGGNVDYTPPQNLMPTDGKVFSEKEAKTPITFRWTPIVPKPQEPVIYRLKVWQANENEPFLSVIKEKSPLLEKEIENITQLSIQTSSFIVQKCPCIVIWAITAIDKRGKILGESMPTMFKIIVTDPSFGGCFSLDTSQYKIVCKGYNKQGQAIYNISNLILKNVGTNPGRTGLISTAASPYVVAPGFTVSSLSPASATSILPGNSISISFDISGVSGTSALFYVYSTIPDPAGDVNVACDKRLKIEVDLPLCYCKDCEDVQFSYNNPSVNLIDVNTGLYTATGNLNISGLSAVYGIEMQVQNYTYTATPAVCSNGVTSIENSGVFNLSGTTINGLPVSMLNETLSGLGSTNNGVAKNIKLMSTTPLPSSIPLNLIFGLPTSLSGLSANCCNMTYTICLKIWVFYDKDKCNSCSFTYCFPAFSNK